VSHQCPAHYPRFLLNLLDSQTRYTGGPFPVSVQVFMPLACYPMAMEGCLIAPGYEGLTISIRNVIPFGTI
jgi:hypothetical protein